MRRSRSRRAATTRRGAAGGGLITATVVTTSTTAVQYTAPSLGMGPTLLPRNTDCTVPTATTTAAATVRTGGRRIGGRIRRIEGCVSSSFRVELTEGRVHEIPVGIHKGRRDAVVLSMQMLILRGGGVQILVLDILDVEMSILLISMLSRMTTMQSLMRPILRRPIRHRRFGRATLRGLTF